MHFKTSNCLKSSLLVWSAFTEIPVFDVNVSSAFYVRKEERHCIFTCAAPFPSLTLCNTWCREEIQTRLLHVLCLVCAPAHS